MVANRERFKDDVKHVRVPMGETAMRELRVGDEILLSGTIVTARDVGHEFMVRERPPYLVQNLQYGALYHCGPVVKKDRKGWHVIAAGPSTSMRVEPFTATVIRDYGLRAVIGKGGLGEESRKALVRHGCVYLHAVGGLAAMLARRVKRVVSVHKLREFGAPDAFWVLEVEDFPAVVTMDSHGESIHKQVHLYSDRVARELLGI
ncbi:MAG TPA: FumA C-terminus/TtdB family hydratase beta subunit [Myxococcota bacterium]|jgi:fumarate hydratase class I|nr:FumA C-terminus/TtdB family hydratase beta subunit [Myxococcota bacterium]